MNFPTPYYGFSCLHSAEQVRSVVDYASDKTGRRLMLGTHMSSKSLRDIPVRRPKRTLTSDQVRGLYDCLDNYCDDDVDDLLFPVIHFDSGGPDIIDSEMLHVDRLIHEPLYGREIAVRDQRYFEGFQINNALPKPEHLRWFQNNHIWPEHRYEIILQLGGYALGKAENDPDKLANLVEAYKGTIGYILLDASGGKGKTFDPEWARPYLRAIARVCPWVGLGVAGGLGPDTLGLVAPLAVEFPNLSIDAESMLRDDQDNFVTEKALLYLDRAIQIFEKNR